MTVSLKHAFNSAKTDGGDATLIQPSNWNAEHELTLVADRVLGRLSTDGAAQELTGANLKTLQGLASTTTDNAISRYDSTAGNTQNSGVTIDDSNNIAGAVSLARTGGVAIQGTNTNDSAAAGYVGEYLSSTVASGSAVSLTHNVAANMTSLSLTAGDWDVTLLQLFVGGTATGNSQFIGSISTTSATLDTSKQATVNSASFSLGTTVQSAIIGPLRVSIASTTTFYAVARAAFSGGTVGAFGTLSARRMR